MAAFLVPKYQSTYIYVYSAEVQKFEYLAIIGTNNQIKDGVTILKVLILFLNISIGMFISYFKRLIFYFVRILIRKLLNTRSLEGKPLNILQVCLSKWILE